MHFNSGDRHVNHKFNATNSTRNEEHFSQFIMAAVEALVASSDKLLTIPTLSEWSPI